MVDAFRRHGRLPHRDPCFLRHPTETVLPLMVAILLVGGGFEVISRGNRSAPRLVVSGTLVGLGGAAMHYSGIAAMRAHEG